MNKSKLQAFHTALHAWYDEYGRHDLPWRNTQDAYAIWVSEVMLQQTQVKTVLDRFYFPFLERFPTLQSLAEASEQDVLKHWQGLGYYSRARNLHKAAKHAAPALPDDYEGLKALPGIGMNTAHAVMAFAFHKAVPVLEANVKRVVARIYALQTPTDAELWDKAEQLLNQTSPFDYNQSMMDVGSMVCTPKAPQCNTCPANMICEGKHSPELYPQKKKRKATPTRHKVIVIQQDRHERLYLTPRSSRFLGGLYGFNEYDATEFTAAAGDQCIGSISHIYSHFKLEADVYVRTLKSIANSGDWHSLEEVSHLPLSEADIKALTAAFPDFQSALAR